MFCTFLKHFDLLWKIDNNREADNKRRSREGSNYDAFYDIARPMPRLEIEGTTVSPQLTLAALQYMSTGMK